MDISLQAFFLISLVMAIVITLLFIINIVFAKKIAAKTRYFMWVVIVAGLLIPVRPTIGNGIVDLPTFTTPSTESVTQQAPGAGTDIIVEPPTLSADVPHQDVAANGPISFQMILLVIWATVAIGIIGYHLLQYIRFQRSIKRWGEFEEDVHTLELFEGVKREMNLDNSKVKLVVCGFVSTSMLTGFFKPVILLPERNYDDSELELIFRHELIHYRRKDLWIKLLSVIALAIHWFNPLVYLMNIALQTEGEASCDQKVLEMSELKSRHFYAEVIIGMIGDKKTGMTTLATNFYGGKKGIKKRLEEIMVGTAPRKSSSYVFLMLVFILTIMSGSVFAMQASTDHDQDITDISTEDDNDIFELAIATIGGGVVTEYHYLSNERLHVHVSYDDEIFLVEINTIDHRVIGLTIYRESDVLNVDGNGQEANETTEPGETDIEEIPTETNTAPPPVPAPPPTPAPSPAATPGHNNSSSSNSSAISRERAGEIALSTSGGRLVEVSHSSHRGNAAWWVETRANGMVHEFYIDMYSGAILEHESELDD